MGVGIDRAAPRDPHRPLLPADPACGRQPTASQLLSPEVRLEETVMLSALGDIQRTAGAPLELDETNDISCKGEPGVSNTFASALWAADYIARAMRAGLRGVDFHTLLNLPQSYTALVGEGASLHPNPEWYCAAAHPYPPGRKGAADGRQPRLGPHGPGLPAPGRDRRGAACELLPRRAPGHGRSRSGSAAGRRTARSCASPPPRRSPSQT